MVNGERLIAIGHEHVQELGTQMVLSNAVDADELKELNALIDFHGIITI